MLAPALELDKLSLQEMKISHNPSPYGFSMMHMFILISLYLKHAFRSQNCLHYIQDFKGFSCLLKA